jgi:hypothetical protein
MHRVVCGFGGLLTALMLFLGPSSLASAESSKPTAASERIEVAAIQVAHPSFKRPVRLLVSTGAMAKVEIAGRAVGLRVTALDVTSASIEAVELERVQTIGPGESPKYQETRIVDRSLIATGHAKAVPSLGLELSVTREEMLRTPSGQDCESGAASAKSGNEECCLSCGENSTFCASCVTADCGMCCVR